MEYYVAVKKEEVDMCSLIWTDAEDIYLRLKKKCQNEHVWYNSSFVKNLFSVYAQKESLQGYTKLFSDIASGELYEGDPHFDFIHFVCVYIFYTYIYIIFPTIIYYSWKKINKEDF